MVAAARSSGRRAASDDTPEAEQRASLLDEQVQAQGDAVRRVDRRTVVTRAPGTTDDSRREGERHLVDDPGRKGRREQRRPAFADDMPQASFRQGVERRPEVDVVVTGDEHGILTERPAAVRSSRAEPAAEQVTSSPVPLASVVCAGLPVVGPSRSRRRGPGERRAAWSTVIRW